MNCTFVEEEGVICNGTLYVLPEERLNYHDEWFWIYLGIYAILVLLAGKVINYFFMHMTKKKTCIGVMTICEASRARLLGRMLHPPSFSALSLSGAALLARQRI